MKAAYFPFTYISEPIARLLAALVGPVAVYQPVKAAVPVELGELATQGVIELRTPMTNDDDRLRAALAEFTEWARQNPGRSTAGTDFLGVRQGTVPFFDETTINRIRSDIRRYGDAQQPEDGSEDRFSARLFLTLAQENDQAVARLDEDLDKFKAMEKEFLEDLKDAEEAGFSRQTYGGTVWREDPGARLTEQRLRAWARLAAADERLPDVLVTTSTAVIDTLIENAGDANVFAKLADVHLDAPEVNGEPLLGRVLSGLLDGSLALTADLSEAGLPPAAAEPDVRVSLFATANLPSKSFIGGLAASKASPKDGGSGGHALVVLVDGSR